METRPNQQMGIQDFACVEGRGHRTWEVPIMLYLIHPSWLGDRVLNVINLTYTHFWQKKVHLLCLSLLNLVFVNT